MKKTNIALILIFLLGTMPFLFVAYESYLIDTSGLSPWEARQAKRAGEFDSLLSPAWTMAATVIGIAIWLPRGPRYLLRRKTFILVCSFMIFLALTLARTLSAPEQLLGTVGSFLRYIDYFVIAPFAVFVAGTRLREIYFPLLISLILLSLTMIIPEWGNIRWSEITYARDTVGEGGSASAIGGVYLATTCGIFLIFNVRIGTNLLLARRLLELTLAGSSLLIIILAFSRGALLAIFLMLFTYSTLGSTRSLQSMSVHILGLIIFITITSIFLSDEIAVAVLRQGQLEGADAGRFEIWSAWLGETTSSLTNFLFGSDLEAVDAPAHNMWLGILSLYGFFALASYAVFHISALGLLFTTANYASLKRERDFARRSFSVAIAILFFAHFENTFFFNTSPMGFLYYFIIGLFVYRKFEIQSQRRSVAACSAYTGGLAR